LFTRTTHAAVESDGFITLYPLQSAASPDAGAGAAAESSPTVPERPCDEGAADAPGRHLGG